jgi:hypothetical protein
MYAGPIAKRKPSMASSTALITCGDVSKILGHTKFNKCVRASSVLRPVTPSAISITVGGAARQYNAVSAIASEWRLAVSMTYVLQQRMQFVDAQDHGPSMHPPAVVSRHRCNPYPFHQCTRTRTTVPTIIGVVIQCGSLSLSLSRSFARVSHHTFSTPF